MKSPQELTALFEEISNSGAFKSEYERYRKLKKNSLKLKTCYKLFFILSFSLYFYFSFKALMLQAEEAVQCCYEKKKAVAGEKKAASCEHKEAEKYQRLREEYVN